MNIETIKRNVAKKAIEYISPQDIVGLGSGTTAELFIEELAKKHPHIRVVASSIASEHLAKKLHLDVVHCNELSLVDCTVDGTDEITAQLHLIKGQGGALVREKILAHASKKCIIIADETKFTPHLGKGKLAIEIIPYGAEWTRKKIENIHPRTSWRTTSNGTLFITENHNFILDISPEKPFIHPKEDEKCLKSIPGVVETGFFLSEASFVLLGKLDGTIDILKK